MKREEINFFRKELEKNENKKSLEELLEVYKPKNTFDITKSIGSITGLVLAVTLFGTAIVSNEFNLDLSNNAFGCIIGIPSFASLLGTIYYNYKEEDKREEKRNLILERLEKLDKEEKELEKIKSTADKTTQKTKSDNEIDIDEVLNDMLFKIEKSNDNDNKEIFYNSDETKDEILKKTKK